MLKPTPVSDLSYNDKEDIVRTWMLENYPSGLLPEHGELTSPTEARSRYDGSEIAFNDVILSTNRTTGKIQSITLSRDRFRVDPMTYKVTVTYGIGEWCRDCPY